MQIFSFRPPVSSVNFPKINQEAETSETLSHYTYVGMEHFCLFCLVMRGWI